MGWRQTVVTAALVIVYGTGADTGLFVYNGTPATGNPPIFWASSATSDPFGNTLPNNATAGVAGTGTFSAGNTIINASGTFTYSGTPALGNLIASTTSAGGFDTPGNEYLAGNTGYTFIGAEPAYYAVQISSNGMAIFRATAAAGPWTQMGGIAYEHGGFAGVQLYDQASGASLTVGDTVDANGNVYAALADVLALYAAAGAVVSPLSGQAALIYANTNSNPQAQTGQGFDGSLSVTKTDTSTHTASNTATSATPITVAYTIPANDAQVGTIYEIETPITGVEETAVLNLGLYVDGTTFTNLVPVVGSAITAGHGFVGVVRLRLMCTATGSGGTYNVDMNGEFEDSSVNRATTTGVLLDGRHAGLSLSTNASHTIGIAAFWASNVASETISGVTSKCVRSGP